MRANTYQKTQETFERHAKTFKNKFMMIEPNWDYFINEPLDRGTQRFETKTERALHASVVAAEANWMQSQTVERFIAWQNAIHDLYTFREGRNSKL